MTHDYTLALLGLPIKIRASSLTAARRKLLRLYLQRGVHIDRPQLPIAPPLILIGTTDPRIDLDVRA